MDSCDKVKAQPKPLSSIFMPIAHYFKAFQTLNDIFIHNSFWRDCPILLFLFSFQRFFLVRFFRNPWVFLKLFYPRIPAVCYSASFFSPAHFAFFEQSKIMFLTISKCRTDRFPWVLINNYLAFQRLSFLFPRVKMLLLIIPIFYPFFLRTFFRSLYRRLWCINKN